MAFSRAKATTWRDNAGSILAAELETLDDNQSKAVDAAGGGEYEPSSPIQIDGEGFGSDSLQDITLTGKLTRNSDARHVWRTNTTKIVVGDGATPQVLDMEYDVYKTSWDHDKDIIIHLAVTSGITPLAGDIMQVVRYDYPTSGKDFTIYSEDAPSTPLAELPTTSINQSNEVYMCEFWFDGTTWRPLRMSADITADNVFHVYLSDAISVTEVLSINNTLQLGGGEDAVVVADSISAVLL